MTISTHPVSPFYTTSAAGYRTARYALPLDQIPADFFADPDGDWTFESLANAAGFAADTGIAIGALRRSFNGHPAGSAIVTLNAATRPYVAIVECPVSVFLCADSA
jgi:hypothetical protein